MYGNDILPCRYASRLKAAREGGEGCGHGGEDFFLQKVAFLSAFLKASVTLAGKLPLCREGRLSSALEYMRLLPNTSALLGKGVTVLTALSLTPTLPLYFMLVDFVGSLVV